jgi:type IV fimbrial biogenesis protein FimT
MSPVTHRRSNRGFTLVESLAALAVSGVLAAAGVPRMAGLMDARAVDSEVSSLASSLRLAKSEAMKRGELVSVCALAPQADVQHPACAPTGKDWSAGWIVFVDRGARGQLDDEDVLIQSHQAGGRPVQVLATLRYISLQATGVSLTAASHFDFLPHGDATAHGASRVCISKPGRLRQLPGVTACTV